MLLNILITLEMYKLLTRSEKKYKRKYLYNQKPEKVVIKKNGNRHFVQLEKGTAVYLNIKFQLFDNTIS